MQNPTNLRYNLSAGANYLTEIDGFISITYREEVKARGKNFRCAASEISPKMPIQNLLELAIKTLYVVADQHLPESICGHKTYRVSRSDLGREKTELGLQREGQTLDSGNPYTTSLDAVKVFIGVARNDDYYDDDDVKGLNEAKVATLNVMGEEEFVEAFNKIFKEELRKAHDESKTSLIRWIFATDHGTSERTFSIEKDWEIDSSFYPAMTTDLRSYYTSFLESRAQILVAFGAPGTGKTSFIRDLICEMNINAFISFDLKILTSDSTFVNYLTNPIFDAIIIEDADELLTSARGEYNKVISKILNISDGLIKLPRKKLIFTTNLPKVSDMDQAIIRPGRCFDVLEFRAFTKDEAVAFAEAQDFTINDLEKKSYTLAELFLDKNTESSSDPFMKTSHAEKIERAFGFVPTRRKS